MKIILNIVQNICYNWNSYKDFILGNIYYKNIINSKQYFDYMARNMTYGNEIEIKSFSEMYNVYVLVRSKNSQTVHTFGNSSSSFKLILLLSRMEDNGHYDILEYNNNGIEQQIKKIEQF